MTRLQATLGAMILALVGFLLFWAMSLGMVPDTPIIPRPLAALSLFGWLACFGGAIFLAVKADTWE